MPVNNNLLSSNKHLRYTVITMDIQSKIQFLSVAILPLLFAITLHEVAHGWVALKLGDKTALMMGRLTLNPIKHIDPIGTVVLPIALLFLGGFIFGWAKPVPVTTQNLRKPKRDMALVALAGPVSNLLMAIGWGIIAKISLVLLSSWDTSQTLRDIGMFFVNAGIFGILINCVLMILNLIPIPPLDGSRVVSSLLPNRLAASYEMIEPYGIWILLALLVFGVLQHILIPPVYGLSGLIKSALGIPG